MIELSKGSDAMIMLRKPNKGVNLTSQAVSTLWIETILHEASADKVYKLDYDGLFYKKDGPAGEELWTTDRHEDQAGDWAYYGWTITANDEHIGLGAFMLEATLMACPSEKVRYNEYDDRAYRFVVKVI